MNVFRSSVHPAYHSEQKAVHKHILNDALWAIKKQAQSIREYFLHQSQFEPSGLRKLVLASEQSIDFKTVM